jgi:hypothetical protein
LDTDFGPLSNGLEIHSSVNESLSKILSAGFEGVGTNDDGSRDFRSLKELDGFRDGKEREEFLDEEGIVSVVGSDVTHELFSIF